jgi:molecular chaperone DnaK
MRRETVETRNQADQLAHQTEKLIEEQDEQMTDEEKSAIEQALTELKSALEDEEAPSGDMREKMDALLQASQAMATRLYQQAAEEQSQGEGEGAEPDDEDVVEAEIIDEEDEA